MNVPNIQALAARLRAPATEGHFNMGCYISLAGHADDLGADRTLSQEIHTCGTTACMAGYAALLAQPQLTAQDADKNGWSSGGDVESLFTTARQWLDISNDQAEKLFTSSTSSDITPETAARVLDRLVETGEVFW